MKVGAADEGIQVLMMALSGITCRADVQRFAAAGVRAVLVGEWLMRR